MRRAAVLTLFLLSLLAPTAGGQTAPPPPQPPPQPPPAPAPPPKPVLPPDATIADVAVGGLERGAARAELERRLVPQYERPIDVRIKGPRRELSTARLGQRIRYGQMLTLAFDLARQGRPVHVSLRRTFGRHRLTRAIRTLARPYYRAPRNARAIFGIRRVRRVRAHWGRELNSLRLRRDLVDELWRPTRRRTVQGHLRQIKPRITGKVLRRIHRTYVSVDRGSRIVRLFKRLRVVRRYRVAVGAAGYATPSGMHRILSKQRDPTWYVPNRAWAGSLAGQTIPPGDPRNPLKARFLAIGGGVGFHGTADLASIGQAASHGCIRMTIPDVISLYNRAPVGTPVLIR
jgi:hypothetical protein